jgi:hypothetical protein
VAIAALMLLVHRTRRLGPWEILGLTAAAATELTVWSALLRPVLLRVLGYSQDLVFWPVPWAVVASFCQVYLALGLAVLWSDRLRADVSAFLRPRPPTFDVLRGCVVAVVTMVALLALVAVPRAFIGWDSFHPPQSQLEQRLQECQAGVQTNFPEFSAIEKQRAVDFCMGRL